MSTLGYLDDQPTRDEIDATTGIIALEFGQNWCGICRASKPDIDAALDARPEVRRIKAADGKGLPLGRSFGITLWPTIVVLRDGTEVSRVVRPGSRADVDAALERAAEPSGA